MARANDGDCAFTRVYCAGTWVTGGAGTWVALFDMVNVKRRVDHFASQRSCPKHLFEDVDEFLDPEIGPGERVLAKSQYAGRGRA